MDPFKKGTSFEIELALYLSKFPDVKTITNVRVYSPQLKKATQIDLVVLTPWGYFCIEAKSYDSEITGNIDDHLWWYRTFSRSFRKINPVNQNTIHTIALSNAIYKRTKQQVLFDNIVVVPDSCTINSDAPNILTVSNFILFMENSFRVSSRRQDVMGLYKVIMGFRGGDTVA